MMETFKKRKNGISVLLATQNSEKTVELSINSFTDFADEIIAVDNGSKDKTVEIVSNLEKKLGKLKFYNVPELPDLYHNRQYALEHANYNWICRFDADFIAYKEGEYDIKELREKILNTKRSIRPISFGFIGVNLMYDYTQTGISNEMRPKGVKTYVPPTITSLNYRIYQYFPRMKFKRLGRWEGVRFQRYLKHLKLEKPYWFHCEIKSDMDYFYRSERTNWREQGDFKKYPTLDSFVSDIIRDKYGTDDIEEACELYMQKDFYPYIEKYDPEKYYPYPKLIKEQMKKINQKYDGKE